MPPAAGGRQPGEIAVRRLFVRDLEDLRIARQQKLVVDVPGQVAKAAAKGDVLRRRKMLVAEDQNLMVKVRLMHACEGRVVERFRQIQTNDFCTKRL